MMIGPDISPTSTPINSRKSDRASLASPPKEMPQPSTGECLYNSKLWGGYIENL